MTDYILVALAVAVSDAVWAMYFRMVAADAPHRAALTSIIILCVNAFIVHSYMKDPILLTAAAVGGYIGTYVTVRWTKKPLDNSKRRRRMRVKSKES